MMTLAAMANPHHHRRKGALGFTLIELLVTMAIISILAGIALPILRGVIVKARAADVVGDMNVIKVAVLTYQSDHNAWPGDRNRGVIPPELREYLPEGFSFRQDGYTLDYDDWSRNRRALFNVGITAITDEEELGRALLEMLGENAWTNGSQKFTWVIDG
jgi:prepilin-type N-terminal cleavage/methylation domain-containing protein